MKIQLVGLLLLAAGFGVALNTEDKCVRHNPFLAQLANSKLSKVQVFSLPKLGTYSKCQSLWNEHGSCCEVNSLIDYANKDRAFIHENMEKLKSGITEIFKQLKSFTQDLEQFKKLEDYKIAALQATIESLQKNNPHLKADSLDASLEVLGFTDLRILSEKALVSTEVCLGLYAKCELQVSAPTIFFESLKKDLQAIKTESQEKLQSLTGKSQTSFKPFSANDVYKQKQIEMMSLMLKSSHHTLADKVLFCEKLIKLVELPHFFRILEGYQTIQSTIKAISNNLKRIPTELQKQQKQLHFIDGRQTQKTVQKSKKPQLRI